MLDERKKKVLAAIIQDYIAHAEPVGSRTIVKRYNLDVSPATIRNEMADLEEMGLIEQPYTSAGRIPSEQGYRYYVDCLMQRKNLSEDEVKFINTCFARKMQELKDVIQKASNVLSELTSYTAVVVEPKMEKSTFKFLKLLPLATNQALLVVVTNTRVIQHRTLNIPEDITHQDLEKVSQVLNSTLQGLTLEEVSRMSLNEIYDEVILQRYMWDKIVELVKDSLFSEEYEERIYIDGTINMLDQPEFKDIDKVKSILKALQEGKILKQVLLERPRPGLSVSIGQENRYEGINECSLITATYEVNGNVVGTLGIIGPIRMDYSRGVSAVDYVTKMLSGFIKKYIEE